jgi:predicted nucleic acid-binding protein
VRALLDINVLVALLDSDHVDHQRARGWIESQPRYPSPVSPTQAIERLARATRTEHHEYWPCSVSVLDDRIIERSQLHSSRQITDAYLLALAVAHGGRLVTFDKAVPLAVVLGAERAQLTVIG